MIHHSATRYTCCSTANNQSTKEIIQKVRNLLPKTESISSKTFKEASATSVTPILKINLGLRYFKKIIELSLSDNQKIKRKQLAKWIRTNFPQEDTLRILFSVEKFFETDGF